MQELDRFNILLDTMHKSLSDLQKALSGVIGMGKLLKPLETVFSMVSYLFSGR